MYKIKTYQNFRKFYLLIKKLEAKRDLTKLGGTNNSDHDCNTWVLLKKHGRHGGTMWDMIIKNFDQVENGDNRLSFH